MHDERLKKAFLNDHIFAGLRNLNDGFDASGIRYFNEEDFEVVLNRIRQFECGILGIEPWHNGSCFAVLSYADYRKKPTDPEWYFKAFQKIKSTQENLLYSATYYVPKLDESP